MEITLKLNQEDLDNLLEGLSEQADAWERAGEALHIRSGGSSVDRRPLAPTDVAQLTPAERLAGYEFAIASATMDRMEARYRDLMDKILEQTQRGKKRPEFET